MTIDWHETGELFGALVGAAGGMVGVLSLALTIRWRHADQRKLEDDRLTVDRVAPADGGLSFWVRYATPECSESLEAHISVLDSGVGGPFVEDYVQTEYNPAHGSVSQVPPTRRLRMFDAKLGNWTSGPRDTLSAWVVAHGSPPPAAAKLRIIVRAVASRRVLARNVFHVAT
jgi:hypothetical protein